MIRVLSSQFVGGHLPTLISQHGRQRFLSKISFIRMLISSTVTLLSGYNHPPTPAQSLHFVTLSGLGFQHMHSEETSIHPLVYVIQYRCQDLLVEKGGVYNKWPWENWAFTLKKWSLKLYLIPHMISNSKYIKLLM